MTHQKNLVDLVKGAFECSVYVSPRHPGLTEDEVIELCRKAGFLAGETRDALREVAAQLHGVGRLQLRRWQCQFHFPEEPDYRNVSALEFVCKALQHVVRERGRDQAWLSRAELVERATVNGLPEHDVEVAITLLVLDEHLVEDKGVVRFAQRHETFPLPSEQIAARSASDTRTVLRKDGRAAAYPLVLEILSKRQEGQASNGDCRRSRVQLLDLQREIAQAKPASYAAVAARTRDFAAGLPTGDSQQQMLGYASTLSQVALSTQRRSFALNAIGSVCRSLHRHQLFHASPDADDASYWAFLRAAVHVDQGLSMGESISIAMIEKRAGLPLPTLHAAVARALEHGLAYVSDVDDQPYSIQINVEDVQHTIGELGSSAGAEPQPMAASVLETVTRVKPASEWSNDLSAYTGRVHVAIITIKPEEEDEVLKRFPRQHTVRGERNYGLSCVTALDGEQRLVATVRQPKQGNIHASTTTMAVISDLDPDWILLVGIAGASPFGDAVLGDVVLGTHTHDLTVHVRNADGGTRFSSGGGAATVDVEATVVHLRPELVRAVDFPAPLIPLNPAEPAFTTDNSEVNKKIAASLTARFSAGYAPKILDGTIISTDGMVKDVELVKQWSQGMRNALAIEMESAGAHNAARRRDQTYRMLAIRGISDIVGLEKQEGAVLHACQIAAETALQFVRRLPLSHRSQ